MSKRKKTGVDTKSIQKILGHTKYSFTEDNYIHTDIEELRKEIEKCRTEFVSYVLATD